MSSKALLKVLTNPSKIASALDWRKVSGSILSLDIHKDRIGVAVASHPSFQEPLTQLKPIALSKKTRVSEEAKDRLADIVKEHKVCGVVVSWPLQQDTGKMGAACGRVLYALDSILADSNVITPNRPLCLWDGAHATLEAEDEWGRCTAYSRTSSKKVHRASVEQYHQDENMMAVQVWDDFCRVHWPEIYQTKQQGFQEPATSYSYSQSTMGSVEEENWVDTAAYVDAAVL